MKMITTTTPVVSLSNAQLRKIKKPLIERRRRERINECLCQLKSLVLEAMDRDESCYSKMEKADILEMTVSHLRSMQRHHASSPVAAAASIKDDAMKKYLLGFRECAKEVGKYLSTDEGLADNVGAALTNHLVVRFGGLQRIPETAASFSQECFSTGVDRNFNLLVPPPVRGVDPDLSDAVSRSVSAVSLNPDLFHEINPLNDSAVSLVLTSFDVASSNGDASGVNENSPRSTSRSSTECEPEAMRFRATSEDPGLLRPPFGSFDAPGEAQLPPCLSFALLTQRTRSMTSRYFPSSAAFPTSSPGVMMIPEMPTDVERAIKSELLLSSSIWRPW